MSNTAYHPCIHDGSSNPKHSRLDSGQEISLASQKHGVDDPKAICGWKQKCVLDSYPVGKQHPHQRFDPNMVAGTFREFSDSIENPDFRLETQLESFQCTLSIALENRGKYQKLIEKTRFFMVWIKYFQELYVLLSGRRNFSCHDGLSFCQIIRISS
jgi:hypothetical protein